jgi:hypothetical protein
MTLDRPEGVGEFLAAKLAREGSSVPAPDL